MNERIDQLVRTLFQKDTLENCSLDELRVYAHKYPYFGAAQLLLTKKLQAENKEEYKENLQRTYSFFHNPLWVETILEDKGRATFEIINIDAATEKEEVLFEPYHTVDYFASQGIKLKEEEKAQDKLSQQLLSFTEWLKTLKKMPAADAAAQIPAIGEKKVAELAEHSLDEKQVLTESMAVVWGKQGNLSKAIDIYQKLSLLEPAKSAYFTAKIDALKK